ncbi:AI-2E family transporter [Chungangia koreensis]|uniref:AI-2E family transporter n=1 Tax=Chungangia koreensis TaxID=752657 RepID=A0ABV8X2T4_9LACT
MKMDFFKPNSRIFRIAKQWVPILLLGLLIWKVMPVALAIFTAYFFHPIMRFFKGVKIPLWIGALLTECLAISCAALLLLFSVSQIISIVPEIQAGLEELNINMNQPENLLPGIIGKLSFFSERIVEVVSGVIQGFSQQLLNFTIFIITFFFALMETGKSRFWFLIYIPKAWKGQVKKAIEEAGWLFWTFLSVEFRLFMITFALLSLGFFALGFTLPVGKAFLISLADALPFLGIGLFLIPLAIYFAIIGKFFLTAALLILFAFIQLTRQMTESYFWASTFHIRSVHSFMISACSLYLFGILGILISPFLILAALKIKDHRLFT